VYTIRSRNASVGRIVSCTVLANRLEAGRLTRYEIAKVTEVAPLSRDSGTQRGRRNPLQNTCLPETRRTRSLGSTCRPRIKACMSNADLDTLVEDLAEAEDGAGVPQAHEASCWR
jgi:hypothetical protein